MKFPSLFKNISELRVNLFKIYIFLPKYFLADDSDIPMLDVGDFEVLDEYVGEDDDMESERHRHYTSNDEDDDEDDDEYLQRRCQSFQDEDSMDNTDHVLDVSIDVDENDFLENVATDLSKNLEDDDDDYDTNRRHLRSGSQQKRLKQPSPAKAKFQQKKDHETNNTQKDAKIGHQNEKPSFLRSDITDEELMEHFDEIENAELKAENVTNEEDDKNLTEVEQEPKAQNMEQEEDWDKEEVERVKRHSVKLEELELREEDEWYRPKVRFNLVFKASIDQLMVILKSFTSKILKSNFLTIIQITEAISNSEKFSENNNTFNSSFRNGSSLKHFFILGKFF